MVERNCLVKLLYWLSNVKEWWPILVNFIAFFVIVSFVRFVMWNGRQACIMILLTIVLPWLLGLQKTRLHQPLGNRGLGSPMTAPLWLIAANQLIRPKNPRQRWFLLYGRDIHFFSKRELFFRYLCFNPKQSNFTVNTNMLPHWITVQKRVSVWGTEDI